MIQAWPGVSNADGSYDLGTLQPSWWNNTADVNLNFGIIEADTARYFAIPGPIFSVHAPETMLTASSSVAPAKTRTAADGSQTTSDSENVFQTTQLAKPSGLSKGAMAAAIVVPIVVVAILVGVWVKFARMKEREKRKRWSEHVDRRMSTISGDWSRAGSMAGMRQSMASSGTRANSAYFANSAAARQSTFSIATQDNMAGAGAGGGKRIPRVPAVHPEMRQSQFRSSIFTNGDASGNQRQSRISFADDVRKSRVSFSDTTGATLRPTRSNLSGLNNLNGTPSTRSIISMHDGQRHSMDNARLASFGSVRQMEDGTHETLVSPSQTAGPFAIPSTQLPAEKKGFFSAMSSAVGLRDKKTTAPQQQSAEDREKDLQQYQATRESNRAMGDMEANMARRSDIISQYSNRSQDVSNGQAHYTHQTDARGGAARMGDDNSMEEIAGDIAPPPVAVGGNGSVVRATSPMGMQMPSPGMNPDQLLAAYAAARAKAGGDAVDAPATGNIHLSPSDPQLARTSVASLGSEYSAPPHGTETSNAAPKSQ